MADNTQGGSRTGPDPIRTIDKTATTGAKIAASVIDVGGGADSDPEKIVKDAAGLGMPVKSYDGDQVTLGTKADAAATDSTSSWSVIALLKGLWAKLAGTLTVGGTVTANAGTGNFTVVQATGTNLHAVVDSGTIATVSTVTSLTQLNGVAITLNKGASDAGTQRVTLGDGSQTIGTVTANAGTNLNTSALALESGGNLATLAGAISGGKVQVGRTASALPGAPAQVTVGNASSVQLDSVGYSCAFGVLVKALDGNTGTVYVGKDTNVTTSTGFELGAGESVVVPLSNTNLVWAIASAASQKVSILGV